MGIKIGNKNGGDLKGTSKQEKEARLKSFSAKQNATVSTRISQSENGFKGESKNEYGLPNGNQQVEAPREGKFTGPKSREVGQKMDKEEKYKMGTKGIKMKKKEDPSYKKPGDDYRGVKDGKKV